MISELEWLKAIEARDLCKSAALHALALPLAAG